MCGIVGFIGNDGVSRVVRGLEALEYRGYDSYGLALLKGNAFLVDKDTGSVSKAARGGRFDGLGEASLVLGHTRWATHGRVTQGNAHPHLSFDGRVAIVHNGVIENHLDLRRKLESRGVEFHSETDSEVVAHLVATYLSEENDAISAITAAISQLEGEYALGIALTHEPDTLYGVKRKSPLVLCWNGEEAMLASDQMAAVDVSHELVYLRDGDIARLRRGTAEVFTLDGTGQLEAVERPVVPADVGYRRPDKEGYTHFMLKEIHEVPAATRAALRFSSEQLRGALPAKSERLTLVGAGSAFYVASIGQYFFNRFARMRVLALPADEATYWSSFDERDALIVISQSGETFDTLEVARLALDRGAHLTSVTNAPHSTVEQIASHRLPQGAGPEICVLSTKSIVNQVVLLARMAVRLGLDTGHLSSSEYGFYEDSLARLPETLESVLSAKVDLIRTLANTYSHVEHWFFIGRGPLYPTALESALKFKEVSYRHAEGLPAGFFKHGTISLIDDDFYTVALLPSKRSEQGRFRGTLANVSEIAARRGPVLGFGPEEVDNDDLQDFTEYIGLPLHGDDIADTVVQLLAGQLFAYYCALSLGREIDQPRSLAKSVTVR